MEKFLNKLAEDEKLRSEFLKQTTPEGAYEVAKPYIGSMSMEEFAEQMVGLAKLMTKAESGELSEDDLDSVAGGAMNAPAILGAIAGVANGAAIASQSFGEGSTTDQKIAGVLAGGLQAAQGIAQLFNK